MPSVLKGSSTCISVVRDSTPNPWLCLQIAGLAAQSPFTCGVHSTGEDLRQLRRGKPRSVPSLRVLRNAFRRGRGATRSAEDRHGRLLGPRRLDEPRRVDGLGVAARASPSLLRRYARCARASRRSRGEVHRRRDHGGLRAAEAPRGRRAARGDRGTRDAGCPRELERGARAWLGSEAREPNRREHRRSGRRGRHRRPAARHGGHGERRGPPRTGRRGRGGASRRPDVSSRPRQRSRWKPSLPST